MKNDFWGELKQREITVLELYYQVFFLKQEIQASIDIIGNRYPWITVSKIIGSFIPSTNNIFLHQELKLLLECADVTSRPACIW